MKVVGNMLMIKALPCRQDNYIWLLHDAQHAWVIDPSLAEPVLDYLELHGLVLVDILITHHHFDHVTGIAGLLPILKGRVIGASLRIDELTDVLPAPSHFKLGNSEIAVELIPTHGHTYDHVSYYVPCALARPILFCGDTIFSGGCGRLFDGTIEQLFDSFVRLMGSSDDTLIACAHEYTLSNLRFALAIDDVPSRYNTQVQALRADNQPSLPTTLAVEKSINPYMRCVAFEPLWIEQLTRFARLHGVQDDIHTPLDAFRVCRRLKDGFV